MNDVGFVEAWSTRDWAGVRNKAKVGYKYPHTNLDNKCY